MNNAKKINLLPSYFGRLNTGLADRGKPIGFNQNNFWKDFAFKFCPILGDLELRSVWVYSKSIAFQ